MPVNTPQPARNGHPVDQYAVEVGLAKDLLAELTHADCPPIDGLTRDDFALPAHRTIFTAIQRLKARGLPPNPMAIVDEMTVSGTIDTAAPAAEIIQTVTDLPFGVPYAVHAPYNAARLRDMSAMRRVRERLNEAIAMTADPAASLDDVLMHIDGAQTLASRSSGCKPIRAATLRKLHPAMSQSVIRGMLRRREVMNLVSVSKAGKTWLSYLFALSVAKEWKLFDRFETVRGPVLIIDAELHAATIANRFKAVCDAMELDVETVNVDFDSLRGRRRLTIPELPGYLKGIPTGHYSLIVLDAWYKLLPDGCDENSNSDMAKMFAILDQLGDQTDSGLLAIHHSSKGSQGGKRIVDVGSGASSQSRSADSHVVIREHEEPNAYVFDGVVRSFAPFDPFVISFQFPRWHLREDLDPNDLKQDRPRRATKAKDADEEPEGMTPEEAAEAEREKVYAILCEDFADGGAETTIRDTLGMAKPKLIGHLKALQKAGRTTKEKPERGKAKWLWRPVISHESESESEQRTHLSDCPIQESNGNESDAP